MEEYHLILGSSVTYRLEQHYAGLKMKRNYYAQTTDMVGSLKAVLRELDMVQMSSALHYHLVYQFSDTLKDHAKLL